jgi:hypothetical protein
LAENRPPGGPRARRVHRCDDETDRGERNQQGTETM